MNEIETKLVEKIKKTKSWLIEKSNKIDKRVARLTREKQKRQKVPKSRMEERRT